LKRGLIGETFMKTLEPHFGHFGKERILTSSGLGSYPHSVHLRVNSNTHHPPKF